MHTLDNLARSTLHLSFTLGRLWAALLLNITDLLPNPFGIPGCLESSVESGTHHLWGGCRAISSRNEPNGKQLETNKSNSDEESPSELEIEERLAGGIRRSCKEFNGSTQPRDLDVPYSREKLTHGNGRHGENLGEERIAC